MNNIIGKNIYTLRKKNGLTQEELADRVNVSFQAVSKWENGHSMPDISVLPLLANTLHCNIDSLLGYAAEQRRITYYEERYRTDEYYWGIKPSDMCFEVMKLKPPVKPLSVLDIGCGEGKDAVFFARNGYNVTAFDITESGLEKAKRLADGCGVNVNLFRANVLDFRLDNDFDIIFCSGVLNYVPEKLRAEITDNYKAHTADGGINAMNVFVQKPFIETAPDKESSSTIWLSGELFSYYHDWMFRSCDEVFFDCMSGGKPHKHCMDTVIAEKKEICHER